MPEQTPSTPTNNELAMDRTDMAKDRTAMAEKRTAMSERRTNMAIERTDLADTRTELARERTRAAQERTLMAWIRTSLSMISFGFGIDRFFKYLDKTETGTGINALTEERILGLSLMSLGIFALGASLITHWRTLKNIDNKEFKYIPQWSQGFTVGIILLFIGLAAFIPLFTADFNLSAIFTPDSQVIKNLVALTIFLIMLTMGVKIPLSDLVSLKDTPKLLINSLVSVLVLFPLVVGIILTLIRPAPGIMIGLVLLAACPAPPLLTKRALLAGGNYRFSASLQVILSLLAIVFTPLILIVFNFLFPIDAEAADFIAIAKQIAFVQFLPLSLGLLIRKLSADLGDDIGNLLLTVADTLFIVLILLLLIISLNILPLIGIKGITSIAFIVIFGLAIGHLITGKEQDFANRSTLATATIARNLGLAIFIALANDSANAIPCIIAYAVLGGVFALPYNVWVKKQSKTA